MRPGDSLRKLIATSLLRTSLCTKLQLPNNSLIIQIGEYGKPFIAANYNLHFNLSHSGDYIVCAFNNSEIGIDIEEITERDAEAISAFFSLQEKCAYNNKSPIEKEGFFFDLWTAKESFIKAIGNGFAIDITKFTIHFDTIITAETTIESRHWHFKQYEIDPKYKMTVCSLTSDFPQDIRFIKFNDVVSCADKLIYE